MSSLLRNPLRPPTFSKSRLREVGNRMLDQSPSWGDAQISFSLQVVNVASIITGALQQQPDSVAVFPTVSIPEPEQSKAAVLNTLASDHSRLSYAYAIDRFIAWFCSESHRAPCCTMYYRPCSLF